MVLMERKIINMKLNSVLFAGLVSVGLLTMAQIAYPHAVTSREGTPVDFRRRQAIVCHTRRLSKLGRQIMLGPITRLLAARSRQGMS
jgi:hypothetical protein